VGGGWLRSVITLTLTTITIIHQLLTPLHLAPPQLQGQINQGQVFQHFGQFNCPCQPFRVELLHDFNNFLKPVTADFRNVSSDLLLLIENVVQYMLHYSGEGLV